MLLLYLLNKKKHLKSKIQIYHKHFSWGKNKNKNILLTKVRVSSKNLSIKNKGIARRKISLNFHNNSM